jgi:nucleoid DNA-binding protein
MTYNELLTHVSHKTGMPVSSVRRVFEAFFTVVTETIILDGDEVRLAEFGKFFRKEVKDRNLSGFPGQETARSQEKVRIGFSAYNKLKARIDEGKIKREYFRGFLNE